jgi:hypothetical protein
VDRLRSERTTWRITRCSRDLGGPALAGVSGQALRHKIDLDVNIHVRKRHQPHPLKTCREV